MTRQIALKAGGDEFTSAVSFETMDANDNVIQTGVGTETAVRAE